MNRNDDRRVEDVGMTDELQLLFIASKYRLGSNDISILHELVLKEEIDWALFLSGSSSQGFSAGME